MPLTTATGTHNFSLGKMNCFSKSLVASVGNWTIRSRAVLAGESSSQLNLGWDEWGLESFFIRSNAPWWRTIGRSKALAMDAYVISSCLEFDQHRVTRRGYRNSLRWTNTSTFRESAKAPNPKKRVYIPGNNKVITVAHAANCFDDLAFVVRNYFDAFELLRNSER